MLLACFIYRSIEMVERLLEALTYSHMMYLPPMDDGTEYIQ